MFDNTDADFMMAHALYKRCAYEAVKALRASKPADASQWASLADSLAKIWTGSDKPESSVE